MLNFPVKTIETRRLYLHPYSLKWYKEFHHLVRKNRLRLSDSFSSLLKTTQTEEETYRFIQQKITDRNKQKSFGYMIFLKDSPLPIGHFNIKDINRKNQECEMAYFIDEDYAQQGLISEAFMPMLEFCFDELNMTRVTVRIVTGNAASLKVAEKSGLKYEGTYYQDYLTFDNRPVDTYRYGISRNEFVKLKNAEKNT
jgi:RimJ/RimL family protein N-acetyltransferase